ncbi:hypothetical protein HYS48_02510 [Candidatus Woesearchaeota archaeon]|nr:hypothetical protein [Candidatus Woesearchaeota archaeon]
MVEAYLTGIFPRSQTRISAGREYTKGNCTEAELREIEQRDAFSIVQAQQEAGLNYIQDPLFWPDLLFPFSQEIRGIKPRKSLKEEVDMDRWFDTNKFFPRLEIQGKLKAEEPFLTTYMHLDALGENGKVVLPSPFLLASLSNDRNKTYASLEVLVEDFAAILAQEAEFFAGHGIRQIQFTDPCLVYEHPGKEIFPIARRGLERVVRNLPTSVQTILFTYFGNAAPYFAELFSFPVDGIGFDAFAIDAKQAEELQETAGKGVVFGAVHAQHAFSLPKNPEEPEMVWQKMQPFLEKLKPLWFAIAPTGELTELSYSIALEKIRRLGAIKRYVQDAANV